MRPPIWMIFAPLDAKELKREIEALLRDDEDDGRPAPAIEVIPGRGRYAAAFTHDPMLADDDLRVGSALAQRLDDPVWTTHPFELLEYGEVSGFRYQRGQEPEDVEEDYESIAQQLDVPLEDEAPPPRTASSVVVIDGAWPDEVKAAFLAEDSPAGYRIAANRRGTVIAGGGAEFLAVDLSYALPDCTVYTLTSGPTPTRFAVTVRRGGRSVGRFEADATPVVNAPPLANVDGARTPAEILQRLDVSIDLFL